jgi:hypothetical protein
LVSVEGCARLTEQQTIVLYESCEIARLSRAEDALDVSVMDGDAQHFVQQDFTCLRVSGEFRRIGSFVTVGYFFGSLGHVTAEAVRAVACR